MTSGLARDKILLAFEGSSGTGVSGTTLARHLRVSRTAIWKHIQILQRQGLPIQTLDRQGYRFRMPFDFSLLKRGRARAKPGPYQLHYALAIPSTQLLAKQAAARGMAGGHVWVTETQSAGRGRLDRAWESSAGGLWFSMLLRPSLAPAQIPPLALVTALVLAESVEETCGVRVSLKWPNDVVAKTAEGWRKAGGILTEMSGEMDRTHWVVIGIGLNVNNLLSPPLRAIGVPLSALKHALIPRAPLLDSFLRRFGEAYRRFQKEGFESFRAAYWKRYSRPNEKIELRTAQGIVRGTALGVDARGALLIESLGKKNFIFEGEIIL